MAGSATNYMEDAQLNVYRGTNLNAFTPHAALFTAISDGETSSITEVTGGSYARQPVTFGAPTTNGAARQIANSAEVSFPTATANQGTVVGGGIFDASSGGNLTDWFDISPTETVNTGTTVKFPVGNIVISRS